jgi:translocation and assembly module TamB
VRLVVALGLVAIAAAAALATAVAWLTGTSSGIAAVVGAVNLLTPAKVQADVPQGTLRTQFGFARLRVRVASTEVDIHELRARIGDFGWRPPRVAFDALSAARVEVNVRPGPEPSSGIPASIASPVQVSARRLAVSEFRLRVGPDQGAVELGARTIETQVTLGPDGYRVERGVFEFGRRDAPLAATLAGSLGGARPFALDARADVRSTLQDKRIDVALRADGSLERLGLAGTVSGAGAGGTFEATVLSFGSPALQQLRADLDGIDPHVWSAAAPRATLRVRADVRPVDGLQFGLAGPVRIQNAAHGPIDADRIPARSATALVRWVGTQLRFDGVAAELVRGSARGRFSIDLRDPPDWRAEAQVRDVDPATVHTRLRPLRIDGHIETHSEARDTRVIARLQNRGDLPAVLDVDLRASRERVALDTARLVLGEGSINLVGNVGLTGNRRVSVNGNALGLDPALLVSGADARLTGIFALDATLEPQPSGHLDFELSESVAFGRPLAGRGTASLSPAQELAVDLDLAVRSARVRANGGLGGADQTLSIDLAVPALDELGLPVKGSLIGGATLRGHWRMPAIDGQLRANGLAYGPHSVDDLLARFTYGGGTDGALTVRSDLAGHHWAGNPIASVRSASLQAEGRLSDHSLRLRAVYDESQEARLTAAGGWIDGLWRGRLTETSAGAPIGLRHLGPVPVEIGAAVAQLGPARLEAFGARIDDLRLEARPGLLTSSGRFDDLRPADLMLRPAVLVLPRGPRDPLVLRGRWNLRAGDRIDGEAVVERAGGDLYASAGVDTPMGLRDLRLQAVVRANALSAEAVMRGDRLGFVGATLAARLEQDAQAGWRLAPKQPWRIEGQADVPSIEWMNALLTDRVRANVRIGGRLTGQVKIAGTPSDPQATGRAEGSNLRVAWIDQGVRLENGRLAATLDGATIVLEELRFAGPPRIRPNDARTAAAMDRMEAGFVAVTGRVKLPDLTGIAQVQAQRLPLLQRPDRWAVATGGANIEISPKRLQVNGAVAADAGFVDFSHPDLPSLSGDVVVVETPTASREREPRVAFGFDLGLDLGRAFYLRGSGLDTRVAGAVRLRSEGKGIVRASGALTAEDGVFEGYGQKLRITRGRVNFQGPVDNPGLDVLALRPDLPAEAGDIGVSITRTAANPLIRLYSDPALPDVETLSWLVLGRAPEQSGADNVALARAAVGLLAGTGEGLPARLARQLGIDEISLRTGQLGSGASLLPRQAVAGNLRGDTVGSASAGAEIITVGKRLNEALSLTYEQALSGAANVVQLSYRLSRRLSVIARAGSDNAIDLVYSIAFD